MLTVKRIVTLTCCVAVCLCIAGRIRARAATLPEGAEVLSDILENIGIQNDLTGIAHAYSNLTEEQKLICAYLMGAYNNMYLCARGFQYNIPADESSIKAEFIALGRRVFTFATTDYALRSRFSDLFLQYMSSIIVYASDYNSFNDWYNEHKYGGNKTLYIPYSQDAFDAWTVWYNDPSGDGIASFGDVVSEWDSGMYYDFAFTGFAWNSSSSETAYNNFILNNSPVLYSSVYNNSQQYIFGGFSVIPNALYILRGNNYQYFRYGTATGISDYHLINNGESFKYATLMVSSSQVRVNSSGSVNFYTGQRNTSTSFNDLASFIDYVFDNYTPLYVPNTLNIDSYFKGYYPFINHVFLVDNLNTLSNIEELENTDSLNIVAPGNDNFIITPNGKFLNPVWPIADGDPMNLLDNIINNSVDLDFNPVSEDDYSKKIVNNTTINNYYVSNGELINVPVEWFDNPYTQKLGEDALPFIGFARDCIDTLGDFDIYMYGAIVIGLGGGIVKKLLL